MHNHLELRNIVIVALECAFYFYRPSSMESAMLHLLISTVTEPFLACRHNSKLTQPNSYRDRGDASISWISAAVQLLILMSVDEMMD